MVAVHNLKAMNSQRHLSIVNHTMSKRAEKLASGYKINRAADDAAGLSISEKMRRQVRGLTQAVENAEDGISMVQIADGALNEVQDMLQRMNELCVQAANGINSASDRLNIQDEITQLITEIDRVAETTKFNETTLLDGSLSKGGRGVYNKALNNRKLDAIREKYEEDKKKAQVKITGLNGAYAGREVTAADIEAMNGTKIIFIRDDVVTTQSQVGGSTASGYEELKDSLQNEIVPNAVEEIISAYSPAFDFLKGSSIGMGLKLGHSTDPELSSSTLAYVGIGYKYYTSNNAVVPDMLTYQLCVNLDTIQLDSSGNLTQDSRNKLEVTIVHEMIHAFMDEALTNGMTGTVNGTLTNGSERFPHWFIEGMAQTASGGYYDHNDWVQGLGITTGSSTSDIGNALGRKPLGISNGDTNNPPSGYTADDIIASRYGTGYLACMYLGYKAGGSVLSAANIKNGLSKILKDIRGGDSLQDVVGRLTGKTTLTAFQNDFAGMSEVQSFVQNLTRHVGSGTGGVIGNLTKHDDILSDQNKSFITLFRLDVLNDTVQNKYPAEYDVFSGGAATQKGATGSMSPVGGTIAWDKPLEIAASRRAMGSGAALHVGTDADMNHKIMLYIDAMDAESLGVDEVDVRTEDSATLSIERVALALAQVSAQRSELGACQNRLEHTINNLNNVVENTTAAESQIRDTDMAKEMVAYSNANILQQAGQSMLAQMNQSSQGVLSLIA